MTTPHHPDPDQNPDPDQSPDLDQLTYGEALEELEDLLDELEGADVDVDLLAARVARGVQLVRFCKDRLAVVTADVDEVVAELISVDARTDGGTDAGTDIGGEPATGGTAETDAVDLMET